MKQIKEIKLLKDRTMINPSFYCKDDVWLRAGVYKVKRKIEGLGYIIKIYTSRYSYKLSLVRFKDCEVIDEKLLL